MGLIRGALHLATYGAVSPKSKKQRMASRQLAAMQGKSEAEVKIAGSRNFDWVNQGNIRARQQRELRARQQAGFAGGPAAWDAPSDHPVDHYPVTVPGSGHMHLIYGDIPDAPTLCGKSGAQDVPEALSIDHVTCWVCRSVAGDFGGPPKSPFILTGRCPKCFHPVVWYKQRDKTPVHTATGKFECPAEADSEKDTRAAAGLDGQDGTGVTAELERLAALHSSGVLDDEEFRAAKARIIHGG
jgi:hypothetical protein